MIQKSALILMLSCTTGAGYFIGEPEIGDFLPFINTEFHQVVKKKTTAKPKSFYSQRKTSTNFTGTTSDQFSFFPVLDDPYLNKIVGLNGEIIDKYDSSPAPASEVQSQENIHRIESAPVSLVQIEQARSQIAVPVVSPSMHKTAEAEVGRKNTNRNGIPKNPSIDHTGTRESDIPLKIAEQSLLGVVSYVVQVSSFRQWQQARSLKTSLEIKGYVSFMGKSELPDNKGTWYRVYIGRYVNRADAEMAAARFNQKENRQAMVIRQTG